MSVASEQKFYDYIHLVYEDDDGVPLDSDLGEVLWDAGRGSSKCGDVGYVRIDRITELFAELRQYVINNGIGMVDCSAWGELETLVGTMSGQGRFVFAVAKEGEW